MIREPMNNPGRVRGHLCGRLRFGLGQCRLVVPNERVQTKRSPRKEPAPDLFRGPSRVDIVFRPGAGGAASRRRRSALNPSDGYCRSARGTNDLRLVRQKRARRGGIHRFLRTITLRICMLMITLGASIETVYAAGNISGQVIFKNGFDTDRIILSGPEEVVYDWSEDRCEDNDIPDLSARAFRDADGNVQLISAHFVNRRFRGRSLDTIEHECPVILGSSLDPDPAQFNDHEWLASPYTEDGSTIYALVHNEYQGWRHPGQCSSSINFDCWYNAITMVASTNAGEHYSEVADPPLHIAATVPFQYEDSTGPYGMFTPSNIFEGPGGFKYALVKYDAPSSGDQWTCMMRTDRLSDPGRWRFWNGSSFSGTFVNPYPDPPLDPSLNLCAAIDRSALANMHQSVTYNEHLGRYVLISITGKTINDQVVFGYFYSFSDDLIDWTERKLLTDVVIPSEVNDPADTSYAYASVLDPDSSSINFETADEFAYLYMTRRNVSFGSGSLNRDLIRREIRFLDLE